MRNRILLIAAVLAVCAAIAWGVHSWLARDPGSIKVDARILDEYAGYYDFGNNMIVTIRRDGDRLISSAPEQPTQQLYPQTETKFFVKGEPGRLIFHRNEQRQVDFVIAQWKNFEEKARKITALPPAFECTNAMIAATTGGKAVEAGLAILKEGGSAVDAAMAISLCEIVHAAGSYVSFAGPMMLMYYEASSGRVHYLDAQYNTPLKEDRPRSMPRTGGRTALVPGFMAGVQAAHERFGKVPFKRLFDVAIAMAENGETVSPVMEWWISDKKSVLSHHPETKKIFTKQSGDWYAKGDLFRQPALAATLKHVAGEGASYMYGGGWGRKFVDVIQRNGGKITLEDMKAYKAIWEEPLKTTYRDYVVYAPGISAWGGVNTIEGLNLLEVANLKRFGHHTDSPESLLWLIQIAHMHHLTWALPKSARHDLSPKSRATKETAAWIWKEMQNGTWEWLPKALKKNRSHHTDALAVVDQWGNMAVVNHTINTMLWGNTGLFVDGVSIPDSGSFQGAEIARAGPGKRLPIAMSPVIVLRDGKPVLGSSTTGGGLHEKHLQVLLNILDFGMDPQSATDTPVFFGDGHVLKGSFEPQVIDGVRKLGGDIRVVAPGKVNRGYWVGIQIDATTKRMRGGVSRGLEGQIAGY
ncbi:MAG TPA: gamma-glutamyltransferase [Verrucomicrobiae bacterium]|nr:gamma-glutamyltransferase [Verrucomicrobiae bacterium]